MNQGLPTPLLVIPKNTVLDLLQSGACTYISGLVSGLIIGDAFSSGVQFRLVGSGKHPL